MMRDAPRRAATLALGALVLAGAVVRLAGCFSEPWLDEIWVLLEARRLPSAAGIFAGGTTSFHHLNALLLRALGDHDHWLVYRLHSLLAGVGAVVLAGRIGCRRGRLEGGVATLLVAASYPLVHYSSEARGYSLAVFFALAALLALLRAVEDGERRAVPVYWASCILGFLSQLTFLYFFLAALAWTPAGLRRRGAARVPGTLRLHAAPAGFFAVFWAVSLRAQSEPFGPAGPLAPVIAKTLAYAVGAPAWALGNDGAGAAGTIAAAGVVAAVLLLGATFLHLLRTRRDLLLLHGTVLLAAPAAVLAAARFPATYPRYFLVPLAFFLLSLAFVLADGLRSRRHPVRAATIALLAAMLAGNAWNIARFLGDGRGRYREAVLYLAERTAGPVITVGSDHDFRNGLVLRYFAQRMPSAKPLVYYRRGELPPDGPEWLLTHGFREIPSPPPFLRDERGRPYRLERSFPFASLSGFHWFVYRDAARSGP